MSPVLTATGLVAFPVAAAVVGSIAASLTRPGARFISGVQHLAAGVVLGAVAIEILPDLRRQGHLPFAIIGFTVAVLLLLALSTVERRVEAAASAKAFPVALIVLVGVDLLIDGILVGLSAVVSSQQALIVTIALTLEIVFLSLSIGIELSSRGFNRRVSAGVPALLGLATAVGAIGSAALLIGAPHTVLATMLAFAAAALLFLVTEELLVEAHETPDTPLLTGVFFAGFLLVYALGG